MPKTNLGRLFYSDLAPKNRKSWDPTKDVEIDQLILAQALPRHWAHWRYRIIMYDVTQVWEDPLVPAAPLVAPYKWRMAPKTAPDHLA